MELKAYDKVWLPAFKGAFLIIFGILAMLSIPGTIVALGIMFVCLILMISAALIVIGYINKKARARGWTIASGVIHLVFVIYLILQVEKGRNLAEAREMIVGVIIIWVIWYALTEIIEAVMLYSQKNAFAALFIINALLSLMFAYFLNIVSEEFTAERVFYIGLVAFVTGAVYELSAYLLNQARE